MTWPEWIDELKDHYLADEASAFLLYGNVTGTTWRVGDQDLDCVGVLRAFLTRSRPVVGALHPWPLPSRIEFAGIADRTTFDNLVKAHELVEGRTDALTESTPERALARIWRALNTAGTDQAYLVVDTQRILPGHRKRVEPLPGAPALFEWPTHPALRRSNNLVVFLSPDRDAVRAELASATCGIHVGVEPMEPMRHLVEDVPEPAADDLRAALERALVHALIAHPEDARPLRIPVMDAVASVARAHRPDLWGELTFSMADGEVSIAGAGADAFRAAWRRDIALDAAAGMLLKALRDGGSELSPPVLDPTAVSALTKRVGRLLRG